MVCEVQGREIKIIQLVPEGTEVKQGEIVCQFDRSEIDQNISQQQIKVEQAQSKIETTEQELAIQKNEAQSKVQEAEVEHELAEIDLEKYVEGDYPAEMKDLQGNIALAKMEVERTAEKLEQFQELVKKGFRTQQQLRAVEQEYEQYKNYLDRDLLKLDVKEDFERRRMVTEHTSKVAQASSKVVRARANEIAQVAKAESEFRAAKATFEVEKRQLDEYNEMAEKCTIKAEQAGVVAYANESWYDSSRQIREGAMVYFRQKVFSLPDMDNMQVQVNVHESMVKKVAVGQSAEVRLDSFPGLVLPGTVKSVAQLADSNRSWMSGGSKEYATVVTIDTMPDEDLRPDMTAEVRIQAKVIPDALIVPVSAVAAHKGQHYAFVVPKGKTDQASRGRDRRLQRDPRRGRLGAQGGRTSHPGRPDQAEGGDGRRGRFGRHRRRQRCRRIARRVGLIPENPSPPQTGASAMRQILIAMRLAVRNLGLHKLRSLLTVLGLIFGVASVVAMLAIAEGASLAAQRLITELGATNIIIRSVKPMDDINSTRNSDEFVLAYGLTHADFKRITETLPTVVGATPLREFRQNVRNLDKELEARIVGAVPSCLELSGQQISQGRFLQQVDLDRFANICIIGPDIAEQLFPFGDPIGRSIRIGESHFYRIVGVTARKVRSEGVNSSFSSQNFDSSEDFGKDVYIPLTTDRARFGELIVNNKQGSYSAERIELSQVTVAIDSMDNVKRTAEALESMLEQFHEKRDYKITIPLKLLESAEAQKRIFNMVLGSIAGISLLVGGIGIMNIMLATVTERTREIGIRRALGAKRRNIVFQFLVETAVMSATGGIIGVLLGIGVPPLVTHFSGLEAVVRPWSPILAFLIAVTIGIVFGVYPARRAAGMDPVEALRAE